MKKRSKKVRRQHQHEEQAEKEFAPGSIIENPDWLVGAN